MPRTEQVQGDNTVKTLEKHYFLFFDSLNPSYGFAFFLLAKRDEQTS